MLQPSKPVETEPLADNNSERDHKKYECVSHDEQKVVEYSYEQQLFVGNLKSFVTEDDLKDHFENYGAVAKVNIVVARQGSNKLNYGFVIFEDAEAVDRVFDNLVCFFLTNTLIFCPFYELK